MRRHIHAQRKYNDAYKYTDKAKETYTDKSREVYI